MHFPRLAGFDVIGGREVFLPRLGLNLSEFKAFRVSLWDGE
jgi:hypothetical protein